MKKLLLVFLACFSLFSVTGCNNSASEDKDSITDNDDVDTSITPEEPETPETPVTPDEPEAPVFDIAKELSVGGFATGLVSNREISENHEDYIKVSTPMEFMDAIRAKDSEDKNEYKVIEITADLNLGFNEIGEDVVAKYKGKGLKDWGVVDCIQSSVLQESGISQIEISDATDLTIYSKNGATIKHAGFKITRCKNMAIRNLKFDEMWEWEDSFTHPTWGVLNTKLGDYDRFGWAYFKIALSNNVWIDHCTFGKSFDGQIDASNGVTGIHISWCDFTGGVVSENSYISNMMDDVKAYYELSKNIEANLVAAPEGYDENKNQFYTYLRDMGVSHDTILNALAKPQKKGFLIGDSDDPNKDEWEANKSINFSVSNCKFTNWQDRLPRLRGGNAYVYNSILDSSEFYAARSQILAMENYSELKAGISAKGWKLALTSQAMVTSNGGAVKYKNLIVKGVAEPIKINNKDITNIIYTGKYEVENCQYILNDYEYTGNSGEISTPWSNTSLTPSLDFRWNTEGGIEPFAVETIDLSLLSGLLSNSNYGVGVRAQSTFGRSYLTATYTA